MFCLSLGNDPEIPSCESSVLRDDRIVQRFHKKERLGTGVQQGRTGFIKIGVVSSQ